MRKIRATTVFLLNPKILYTTTISTFDYYILLHIIKYFSLLLYVKAYKINVIAEFVKKRRKQAGLTQEEFAMKAGVALTAVPKIEQGKDKLSLSRVNQVLKMFGHVLGTVSEKQLCDRLQQNTTTFNLAYPK